MRKAIYSCVAILFGVLILQLTALILTSNIVNAVTSEYGPKRMKSPQYVTILANPRVGNPGVYWYQENNGKFRADHSGGPTYANNAGSCSNPFPAATEVPDSVDFSNWPPTDWPDYNSTRIDTNKVKNIRIHDVKYQGRADQNSYTGIGDIRPPFLSTVVAIRTITGGYHVPTEHKPFDNGGRTTAGCPKYNVAYFTPMDIIWEGDLEEEKEIDVTPDTTLTIGQTKQMVAKVKTKGYGSTTWNEGVDVSGRETEIKWFSSDEAVASIELKTGMLKAESPGTVTVRAIWNNGTYLISDTATVTVTSEPGLVVNLPNACKSTTTPLQAEAVLTKSDRSIHKLTVHPKLTWSSSNASVATIGADGKITTKGIVGTTIIKAHFLDTAQRIDEQAEQELEVKECSNGGGGGDTGGEDPGNDPANACPVSISPPSRGAVLEAKEMDPSVQGVLRADIRGAEKFDVTRGIPTSEDLYANVLAKGYLFQHRWVNMTGTVTYDVKVKKTYHKTWTIPGRPSRGEGDPGTQPEPKERDVPGDRSMRVTRGYSYWQIDNLEVYKLNEAKVSNYALGGYGGVVTLTPNSYIPPTLQSMTDTAVQSHVKPSPCREIDLGTQTVPGGSTEPPTPMETSLFQAEAEAVVQENAVNNDKVVFNGTTIMNNTPAQKEAPRPGMIPQPHMIGDDVLYQNRLTIQNTLMNRADQPSTGDIFYGLLPENVNGGQNQRFSIPGINPVTVHTPVVNYAWVSDDQPHNQKTKPDPVRAALILERPFLVRIPTSGQHLDGVRYPGYGNRDYGKYFRSKQVRFPFDVYTDGKSSFIPAQTWVNIPVNQLDTTFVLPVWIDEGAYQIEFRNIAENAPMQFTEQPDANTDLTHHVATDTVAVEVIGRLYDFRITDIADYHWERVFRQRPGSPEPTGVNYWTGTNEIDGDPRGNLAPYVLPIRPGSHPVQGYRNVAVKTGYHFKFDVKTKGNMFGKQDGIRITPTFFYIPKDGTKRQEVDLYYHRGQQQLIRIGSAQDVEKRYVVLNARLRNVPGMELSDTARYQYTHEWTPEDRQLYTLEQAMVRFVTQTSHRQTWTGRYDWMILPSQIRTLIGPKTDLPSGVDIDRANAAIQRWYGEYSLPADVYAVPKGTNLERLTRETLLDDKAPVFLQDGYIVVNFNLETLQNGNTLAPHLQYMHAPLMNQWKLEGFNGSPADEQGIRWQTRDGDVVWYHADQSSRDDFQAQVPH
ncbi:Ig-like domain (group 2) [Paenibacillus polysaccharolyticus]|uniref:Ig-like domain (Group 2) n=1 Tax=Paenibacillus polysaccharolyticus TaxID=582692 RepID=A0A1G5BLY7_9BACL|nr:Ig-like domain (group 2) [Paenibacillus polysaccharolyticus]